MFYCRTWLLLRSFSILRPIVQYCGIKCGTVLELGLPSWYLSVKSFHRTAILCFGRWLLGSIWPFIPLVKFEWSWVDICKRNEGKVIEFLKCAFRDYSDSEVCLLEQQHRKLVGYASQFVLETFLYFKHCH